MLDLNQVLPAEAAAGPLHEDPLGLLTLLCKVLLVLTLALHYQYHIITIMITTINTYA